MHPKPGRPPKIDAVIRTYLHEMLESPSSNMKALVLDELKKKEVSVTWGNIRRVLRKDGYSFRRARRVPPNRHPKLIKPE